MEPYFDLKLERRLVAISGRCQMRTITVPDLLRPKPGGPVERELKAMAEAAGLRPDFAQDMRTARKVQLLFVFLRYSPTYELARKVATGELDQSAVVEPNFDQAISTYECLGPVRDRDFKSWWRWAAVPYVLTPPTGVGPHLLLSDSTIQIGKLERRAELLVAASAAPDCKPWMLGTFLNGQRKNGYTWPRIQAASDAMKAEIEEAVEEGMRSVWASANEHPLTQVMTITRQARNLRETAAQSASENALKGLRRWDPKNKRAEEQQRASVKASLIRELKEAEAIAENAARGSFPCASPIPGASKWDFHQLHSALYP